MTRSRVETLFAASSFAEENAYNAPKTKPIATAIAPIGLAAITVLKEMNAAFTAAKPAIKGGTKVNIVPKANNNGPTTATNPATTTIVVFVPSLRFPNPLKIPFKEVINFVNAGSII